MRRVIFILFYFLRTGSAGGGRGAARLFFSFFSVQQTTSGIGRRAVIPFILDVRFVNVSAGVTQEEGRTGFLHLPSAVLA